MLALGVCVLACTAPAIAAPFVYVPNSSDSDASQFDAPLSSFESLGPLTPPTVETGTTPFAVAVSPDGTSVYTANLLANTVSQYNIDRLTGALSPKSPATVATDVAPVGIAVSPDGKSVYVTNQRDDDVSQYNVDPITGALSPKSPATVAAGRSPASLAVSPDGKSVYVANFDSNSVSQYDVDPTAGALIPKSTPTVATGTTPDSVAVTPDGRSAYVADENGDAVSQYDIDPTTGALSPKSTPTLAGLSPTDITVNPDGNSAYVTNTSDDTVSQYDIDPTTGTLSPKSPATVAAGAGPTGIAVTPDGKSAYVTNFDGITVSQYNIDLSSGALGAKVPAAVAAGTEPHAVAVAPDADVSALVSAPPSTFLDADLTYAITVSNVGPSNAWRTSFTDSLPYGTQFVSASSPGTCTMPKPGTKGGTVSCQLGTIPSGSNVVTQIVVHVLAMPKSGSINDIASGSSVTPDPDTNDNIGTAQTTVTKRPTVTVLTCQESTLPHGQPTTCTATVSDTSSAPLTPTGTVKFTSNAAGDTLAGSPCTLSGSGGVASCQVAYTPALGAKAQHTLTGSYVGDKYHSASKGKTAVKVT